MILKCLTRANPPAKILWIYSMEDSLAIRNNIVIYENQLLILNFSRTTPANYQCIADNGIPPRDTRTSHLVPASKTKKRSNKRQRKYSQEYYVCSFDESIIFFFLLKQ